MTVQALAERVDVLAALLQASSEQSDLLDNPTLGVLLQDIETKATGLPGTSNLVRAWRQGVEALGDGAIQSHERLAVADWFTQLSSYLRGTLPAEARATLAHFPTEVRWMPSLSAVFTTEMARRLDAAAPSPPHSGTDTLQVAEVMAEPATPSSQDSRDIGSDMASAFADTAFADDSTHAGSAEEPGLIDLPQAIASGNDQQSVEQEDAGAFAFDAAFAPSPAEDADAAFSLDGMDADPAPVSIGVDAAAPASAAPAATAASDDGDAPIWISPDERDLTVAAIDTQLLPLFQQWAAGGGSADPSLLDDIDYQSELVTNVLDMVGMPRLVEGMRALQRGTQAQPPQVTPEHATLWCMALSGALQAPEATESLELFDMVAAALPGLPEDWLPGAERELARIRIGLDPSLKAARKTTAEPEDVTLRPADDVLPSVLDGMLRELPGNAERLGRTIRSVVEDGDRSQLDEARRVAHTLKGDANTVGIRGLASITHALEDILIALDKTNAPIGARSGDILLQAADTVEEAADHVLGRGPAPDDILDTYQLVLTLAAAIEDGEALPSLDAHDAAATTAPAVPEHGATAAAASAPERTMAVPGDVLDALQDLTGESVVAARRIDRALERLRDVHREQRTAFQHQQALLAKLDDLIALRGAALQSTAMDADTQIDPLELDQYNELHVLGRQLAEATVDTGQSLRTLERQLREIDELRTLQEQTSAQLQRTVLRTRMVPFGQVASRLQRIARQAAKTVMKPVQVDIDGQDTLLDADLLERVVEPLGHLIRNAIDHGIEAPQQRNALGKSEMATLRIAARLQGDAAVIEVRDDGAGLDLHRIRLQAEERGIVAVDAALTDAQLARLILLPGFSTREEATELSGRGVGMDVVNQRIAALRGQVQLDNAPGRGLGVLLRLPVSQTLASVMVARSQRTDTAVVVSAVERILPVQSGDLRYDEAQGQLELRDGGDWLPAVPMETLYDQDSDVSAWMQAGGIGLRTVDADGRALAVLVKDIVDVGTMVVRPISTHLPPIRGVRGVVQMADGGLAPVVDLDVLAQRLGGDDALRVRASAHMVQPRVIVADDSLGVRRALEQLMTDAGYEVSPASDGLEAIARVEGTPLAAVLLDMEMPRMNGLEVTRALRLREDTRDVPIVMITSRTADKHREMALEAGVDEVVAKPFTDDALVALIGELVASRRSAVAP